MPRCRVSRSTARESLRRTRRRQRLHVRNPLAVIVTERSTDKRRWIEKGQAANQCGWLLLLVLRSLLAPHRGAHHPASDGTQRLRWQPRRGRADHGTRPPLTVALDRQRRQDLTTDVGGPHTVAREPDAEMDARASSQPAEERH